MEMVCVMVRSNPLSIMTMAATSLLIEAMGRGALVLYRNTPENAEVAEGCGIPFEPFVEIGLDLKRRSPFPRTMVIGLANGNNGYLPTPEQHKLGGYETWLGTNKVEVEASTKIVNALLEMFAELK